MFTSARRKCSRATINCLCPLLQRSVQPRMLLQYQVLTTIFRQEEGVPRTAIVLFRACQTGLFPSAIYCSAAFLTKSLFIRLASTGRLCHPPSRLDILAMRRLTGPTSAKPFTTTTPVQSMPAMFSICVILPATTRIPALNCRNQMSPRHHLMDDLGRGTLKVRQLAKKKEKKKKKKKKKILT